MRIVDPAGKWFVNSANFAFNDPESNTRFEPHEPTKATPTAWIEGQPTFSEVPDPIAAAEAQAAADAQAKADAEAAAAAAAAAAEAQAKADAEAAADAQAKADAQAAHAAKPGGKKQ